MGCCSSRQNKAPEPSTLYESPIDSILPASEIYKLVIYELHLTRSFEKVVKGSSEFFLSISSPSESFETPQARIDGLHFKFETPAQFQFQSPSTHIKFNLSTAKFGYSETIGVAYVDMEIFKNCKYFKGSIPVMYRCSKTGSINLEIMKLSSEHNFMTLSDQGIALSGTYLPSRDYPSTFTSTFSPTPKFNTFTTHEPNANAQAIEKLKVLKKTKVNFEFLIENFEDKCPEIMYYVCDKLIFYSYQSSYSKRIDVEKAVGVLKKFFVDPFVTLKALWLLFHVIESSDDALEKWQNLKIDYLIIVWEQFHNQEICSLCLELLIKFIGNDSQRLSKIVAEVRVLAFKSINLYKDGEIICPVLIIIQKILGIPGKSEFWQIILSQNMIDILNHIISDHIINNEIITNALKLILAFSLSSSFTKQVSQSLDLQLFCQLFSIYFIEKAKLKAITQILSQVLLFIDSNGAGIIIDVLFKVVKRNFNWAEILQIIFKSLNKFYKAFKDTDEFEADKQLDLYIEIIQYLGINLIHHEDLIEFIYSIGLKSEKTRRIVWENKAVHEIFTEIKELSQNSSTGSSLFKSENAAVIKFATFMVQTA